MRLLFLFVLFTIPLVSRADLQIQATQKNPMVDSFIKEAQNYLSESFNNLNNNILIQFRALDNFKALQNPCIQKIDHQVYGMVEKNIIVLNTNFLPHLNSDINSADQFPCGHKNYKRLAVATLLHEIAHLYDRQYLVSQSHTYKAIAGPGVITNIEKPRSPDEYELSLIHI